MKHDIRSEFDAEIIQLFERLMLHDLNFKQIDLHYLEVNTPFLTNPDSRNEEWKTKIGLVFYPELLSYGKQTTPWICVRFELEGDQAIARDLCKWLVEKFKSIAYTPFMDEDAKWNYFRTEERKGYTKYKMYVNPDYPQGYWENHTL